LELALTAAALAFALFLFYVEAWIRQKDPVVKILSQNNLLNHRDKADKNGISVLFQETSVENFAFLRIRLLNRGLPIEETDFKEDIFLNLKHVRTILFVNMKYASPDYLKPKFTVVDQSIKISPLLLNQEDHFTLEIGVDLVGDQKVEVLPTARIVGVSSISVEDKRRTKPRTRNIDNLWYIIQFLLVIPAYFLGSWIERMRGNKKDLTKLKRSTS
jgi:hypothetical protein